MANEVLEASKDGQQQNWAKFVRRVNELVDSGELESVEIEYKLELGCQFAEARKAVLDDSGDWINKLENGGFKSRPGHPINWRSIEDLKTWFGKSPNEAFEALKTLWKRGDLPVAKRIRTFNSKLPEHPEIRGKEETRIRLISSLLMGLDARRYPPFATRTLKRAYKQTEFPQPDKSAKEAELYEHALNFLDQFLKEAQAHGARLHDRLDMQSVVWHWQRLPEDLPQLGLPLPGCPNGVETANGWDAFARRVNELTTSDEWYKKEIAPKLEIEGMAKQAWAAVFADADNWADLVKNMFTAQHVFHINRDKVRSWIDESPEDALQAFEAGWTEGSLPVEQPIRAFCMHFPEKVISGRGSRLTVAATLLAAYDAKRFPPFSKEKYDDAYKQTGYDAPEQSADEAALYVHALGFLDRLIEIARAHGVDLRHRLNAFAVVWHLVDCLPSFSTQPVEPKSLHALADELLLTPNFLEEICILLEDKRQVIFQGPPGTGKTYVAQALANCLAGSKDRVELVQFHPSYAYEDFVRGFRPTITVSGHAGFDLQDGPLLRAAQKARKEPDAKHFLIIDEINRGNIAKVFGELYFLLEYRDKKIRMQYQRAEEDNFSLPENLYIIGTMNTADRSIALVDLALRRRFYFIKFHPDKDPVKSVLRKWLGEGSDMEWVADVVDEANELLKDDRHAAIGPSYFMKSNLREEDVPRIWKHSVLPYIEERLFGDDNRIEEFELSKLKARAEQKRRQRQQTGQSGDDANGDADSMNNETDQPSGVSGQQADPSNDQ